MKDLKRTEGEPHDKLTSFANDMLAPLEAAGADLRAVVMVDDAERGGMVFHGYKDDADAIATILAHLRALLHANGQDLKVITIGGNG